MNLVGDVLTVAVFDDEVFDRLFEGRVEQNDEGAVDGREFRFDEATVQGLLEDGRLAPSGAGCLHLAWHGRATILPHG